MEYKLQNVICQNCSGDFTIEPDDFSFYEKMKVPAPTFCPECRMIRRLMWRNERSLHKRECNLCNKNLISMYKDNTPVLCNECFFGDKWNPFSYGQEYDFSQNFFEQLNNLFKKVPRNYAYKFGNFVNAEFVNFAKDDKNCYLSFSIIDCEDIYYSYLIDTSKKSMDCLNVIKLDQCYQNINSESNYNSKYILNSQNCLDSYFLYDCSNCSNCFMSSNQKNQQYMFFNQKLSKEKYFEEIKNLEINKYSNLIKFIDQYKGLISKHSIHKYAFNYANENVTGNYVHNVRNAKKCFDVYNSENIAYSFRVLNSKDSMDNSGCGYGEMIYESMAATMNTFFDRFCYITIAGCRECEYSMILKNCSNCFACVGLTNAQYCIFNKQYSKEEYFEMVEKIKNHMNEMPYIDNKGRVFKYGEYFPYDMSPFGYNETNAHDFFSISKEEVLEKGYNWHDREKRDYKITIQSADLPDDINDVNDSILSEVISCPNNGDAMTQCTSAFRIVPDELQFYKQKNLPLPRYCPNCRHYERLSYRNPLKLWHRECMCDGLTSSPQAKSHAHHTGKCEVQFETSYASERPELVYCEKCYQQEVY